MSSQEKIAWESGALIKIPPGVSGMFGIVVLPGGVSLPRGSSLEFIGVHNVGLSIRVYSGKIQNCCGV